MPLYAVLEVVVNHAMLKGSPNSHLAITTEVKPRRRLKWSRHGAPCMALQSPDTPQGDQGLCSTLERVGPPHRWHFWDVGKATWFWDMRKRRWSLWLWTGTRNSVEPRYNNPHNRWIRRFQSWYFKPNLKSQRSRSQDGCGTTDSNGVGKAQGEHEGCIWKPATGNPGAGVEVGIQLDFLAQPGEVCETPGYT